MKKGFTLIELLAVILILGIVSFIAISEVTDIINESKIGAIKRSAENYINAIETYATINEMNGNSIYGEISIIELNDNINVKGELPIRGTIEIENNEVINCNLYYEDYNVKCTNNGLSIIKNNLINSVMLTKDNFNSLSWEEVVNSVKTLNYDSNLLGATRCVALTGFTTANNNKCSNGEFLLRVANISTPIECDDNNFSETACGFVLEFVDLISSHNMNDSYSNMGGWENTTMREYVNTSIYNALPNDLKSVISDTKVVSGHGARDNNNIITTDKLYLLSVKEIWNYETGEETRQLDYYENKGVTNSNYSAVKKYLNGSLESWWIRTADIESNTNFYRAGKSGDNSRSIIATNGYGVSPAFRIK